MDLYLYSVEMPFSGIKIFYRELTNKEQILLSKAHFLLPLHEDYIEDYSRVFREIILNCIQNKNDFLKLNIIEYLIFVAKLRIASIGDTIELEIKNKEEEFEEPEEETEEVLDPKTIKINLDLNKFIFNLYQATADVFKNFYLEEGNIKLHLSWPSLMSESFLLKCKNSIDVLDSLVEYISVMEIENQTISIYSFSNSEKNLLLEKLPAKLLANLHFKITSVLNKLNETTILPSKEYMNFNLYGLTMQNLLRLFFTENLRNIYQEYYVLASKKIAPDVVDQLTIAERKVYYGFVTEEYEASKDNPAQSTTSLQDLAMEFGDEAPN